MPTNFRAAYILKRPTFFDDVEEAIGAVSGPVERVGKYVAGTLAIIPHVSSFVHDQQPATQITLTQGSFVVEGHEDGIRIEDIIISGQVLWPELKTLARDSAGTESDSHRQLRACRTLIEEALKSDRRTVYIYAIDEGVYLEAVVMRMRFTRAKPNATGVRYDLTLRGLRRIQEIRLINAWPVEIMPQAAAAHWYDDIAAVYSTCTSALATAKSWFYTGIKYASMPFDVADKILDTVDDFMREVDAMQSALSTLLHKPRALADRLKNMAAYAENIGQQFKQTCWDYAFQQGLGFAGASAPESDSETVAPSDGWATITRALTEQWDSISTTLRLASVRALVAAGQTNAIDRFWTLRPGDTLQRVASAVYGTPSRAAEIAAANNLRYPWTSASGGSGLARPGARIRIPGRGIGALQTVPTGNETKPEDAIYGMDWRLDGDGDLFRVGSDDDVDFGTITGMPNVESAIYRRMETVLGSNRTFPRYGRPGAIGKGTTDEAYAEFIVGLTDGLIQDDRVTTVTNVKVEDLGDGWKWSGLINLATGVQLSGTGVAP